MTERQQVTIVGGGVIGLSIAWELARRGFRVTLLEREQTGRATSWSAAGILPPANLSKATDPIDQLRGLSHDLFPRWATDLQERTGIDCGLRRCGGWYLANTTGEHASMLGMTGYWEEQGIQCEAIPLGELAQREPALATWTERQGMGSAWWVPDEYQIRPPRLLQALVKACRIAGVEILEHCTVTSIRSQGDRAETIAHGRPLLSDLVIVCSGAWSGLVEKSLKLERSIVPIRGQMLLLHTPVPLLSSIVNLGQRYVITREDGHTLVGSCEEETGFQQGTTDTMLASLHQFAAELVPAFESADRVSAWSGLRPLTYDGFPMIGRVPETENLYVATGHFRSGIHLSVGTAITIADLICGANPRVDLDAFRVGKQQARTSSRNTSERRDP